MAKKKIFIRQEKVFRLIGNYVVKIIINTEGNDCGGIICFKMQDECHGHIVINVN